MQAAHPASPTGHSAREVLWWAYEITLAILAVVVVWLLTVPEDGWVRAANWGIWGVFATDYVVRLYLAPDRRAFVRSHIPELLAALPLEALRIFRLARLARLARAGVILWRVTTDVRRVLGTNGLGYVLTFSGIVIFAGGVGLWLVEPQMHALGDGLWWSIVTATTVGYGDISPAGPGGRLIAVFLMVVGIGTIGMITGSIATHFIGKKSESGNPDIDYIQGRLDEWAKLPSSERRQLVAMLGALATDELGIDPGDR